MKLSMTITQKEIEALASLAGVTENDEFSQYENSLPVGIKAALEKKMLQKQEEASLEAAEAIVRLLELSKNAIKNRVETIRHNRRSEKKLISKINEIERAKSYGLGTNNFLPLIAALNPTDTSTLPEDQRKLIEIPDDFQIQKKGSVPKDE